MEIYGVKVPFTVRYGGNSFYPCKPGDMLRYKEWECEICGWSFKHYFSSKGYLELEAGNKAAMHLELGHPDWRNHGRNEML